MLQCSNCKNLQSKRGLRFGHSGSHGRLVELATVAKSPVLARLLLAREHDREGSGAGERETEKEVWPLGTDWQDKSEVSEAKLGSPSLISRVNTAQWWSRRPVSYPRITKMEY